MKSFLVLGLGRFGKSVAKTLFEQGFEVLAVDKDEENVEEAVDFVTHSAVVDVTDEEAIKSLGINNFDAAIVAIGEDMQASIMTTLVLKEIGIKYIIAKAISEIHGKLLIKVGADKVVYPEREMGERVAMNLASPNVLDYMSVSSEYSIMEIRAPKDWVETTIKDTHIRPKFDIVVMAVKKEKSKEVNIYPKAEYVIKENDILVLFGSEKALEKFTTKTLKE